MTQPKRYKNSIPCTVCGSWNDSGKAKIFVTNKKAKPVYVPKGNIIEDTAGTFSDSKRPYYVNEIGSESKSSAKPEPKNSEGLEGETSKGKQ